MYFTLVVEGMRKTQFMCMQIEPAQTELRSKQAVMTGVSMRGVADQGMSEMGAVPPKLRRHCAHLRHPLIGDTSHGDARHNRLFRAQFGLSRLYLHAHELRFSHPLDNEREIHISSPLPAAFTTVADLFGWYLDGLSQLFNED